MGSARCRAFSQLTNEANALQCVAMILKQNSHSILRVGRGASMVSSTPHHAKSDLLLTDVLMPLDAPRSGLPKMSMWGLATTTSIRPKNWSLGWIASDTYANAAAELARVAA